jgi:hypothetical protein
VESSESASFVDATGTAMLAQMGESDDEWFMSFALPARSHIRVRVRVAGGNPSKLDRVEIPLHGDAVHECVIVAEHLADRTPSDDRSRP